jgi:iron-sulfur cluster repair protein YtfE (RIC family)
MTEVMVTRVRPAHDPPMDLVRDTVPDGVTRCLEADHDRLDHVLADAEREANAGRFAEAHGRFLVFAGGLARHIDAEERVLFPPLLSADPRSRGPVSVMQHEHEELRELLATIGARLAASEPCRTT